MCKQKLFLDIDDTLVDTESYLRLRLRYILGSNVVGKYDNIYNLMLDDEVANGICRKELSDYRNIPFLPFAEECISVLKSDYDIILCSNYTFDEERCAKLLLADRLGVSSSLIRYTPNMGKAEVNMSDGILVDNDVRILANSNAKRKIRVRGYGLKDIWGGEEVEDCFELMAVLMLDGF